MKKPQKRTLIIAAATFVLVAALATAVALSSKDAPKLATHTPVLEPGAESSKTVSSDVTASLDAIGASTVSTKTATAELPKGHPPVAAPSTQKPSGSTTGETPATAPPGGTSSIHSTFKGTITDVRKAFSLTERQVCFYKLMAAEERAIAEATEAYPMEVEDADYDAHYEMRFRLTDEYQLDVRREYDLTVDGMNAILTEGLDNGWPGPPPAE